mgnify:FL=1
MSLPKHNPLLRVLYMSLVLFMFAFMMAVIRMYWPDDSQVSEYTDYSAYESPLETVKSNHAVTRDNKSLADVHKTQKEKLPKVMTKSTARQPELFRRPRFTVTGIERMLNLSANMQVQLEGLWADFYNLDTQQHLPGLSRSNKVYLVYKSYDHDSQSIEVLIGYQYAMQNLSSQVKSVELPKGKYIKRDSVLATWDNPQDLPLSYQLDYEVYEVDEYFNISGQRAFLSTNKGAY